MNGEKYFMLGRQRKDSHWQSASIEPWGKGLLEDPTDDIKEFISRHGENNIVVVKVVPFELLKEVTITGVKIRDKD